MRLINMDINTFIYRGIRESLGKCSRVLVDNGDTFTDVITMDTAAEEKTKIEIKDREEEEEKELKKEKDEVLNSIKDVRNEWKDLITKFEYVSEKELVDYYTFRLKACESRYSYFLVRARELGVRDSFLNNLF